MVCRNEVGCLASTTRRGSVTSLLWVMYAMLNRKAAIYVGNIIGLAMDLLMVNGILMNAGWTY